MLSKIDKNKEKKTTIFSREAMVEPATSRCGIGAVTNTSSASGGGAVTNTSSASGMKNSDSNGSLSEQGQIVFTMPLVQIFRISVSVSVLFLLFLQS